MSDDGLQIFSDEAEDLLLVAEQALLNLENLDNETETDDGVNDLFRTFHTIKGAAGLFGLDSIVEFTHVVESLLGKVREKTLSLDDNMVSLFLSSRDHLEKLVASALDGVVGIEGELKAKDDELVSQLNVYLDDNQTSTSSVQSANEPKSEQSKQSKEENSVDNENWHISLRFAPNALRNGMDPASFISYLKKIGELKSVVVIDDAIPEWAAFDAESCYLGFEISLYAPDTNKEQLLEVFEFVQDDCQIFILPPHSHINSYIKMIEQLPEEDLRIGEILVACGALSPLEQDGVLNLQDSLVDKATFGGEEQKVPSVGKLAVEQNVVNQEVVDAALKKQIDVKQQRNNDQQTIRVNALKLENLVNLVGELVIGSANSEMHSQRLGDPALEEAMENLLRLVEEVRDTALGLRMVPIGETFTRYKRVVREVSRDLGKEIELKISGEDTELDKTLIEKIGDPLMHLVRNAIDHGIETPEERMAAGKPAKGTVKLDAYHDSGSIVIRIKDDGSGLPKDKLVEKAREKGLITADQELSEQEIFQLIFAAGFSTAETLSNLSGRGVGMDVVRKNIEALRGHIEIASKEGQGSTFIVRLPLTLAIIDGFQIKVGDGKYIIPLDMIEECLELDDKLRGPDENANYINLRGEILPFMHLRDFFQEERDTSKTHKNNIVVVECAGKKAGFVVDELLGEHQTVIKPLGKIFQNLRGISGATILGSGEVAMVLDVPTMTNMVASINHSKNTQTNH